MTRSAPDRQGAELCGKWQPDVVAIVHDLRAPLAVIAGYADLLAKGDVGEIPASASRAVSAIAAKAAEIRVLVDGVLDVATAGFGTVPARGVVAVDLRTMSGEALDRAQPRARLWGDELELDAAADVAVRANPRFLGRILDNLINNALTHGRHPGHVTLTVGRRDGHGEVRVEDDGEGLPPAVHARLFSPPAGDDDEAIARSGSGLGLYISRALAERIGGTLRFEKAAGGGAAFVLALPLVTDRS